MADAPPDRRQEIVEAAFRVFARKGLKGATNREIAAEAGVTPGLIYWYFRDKQDLFRAVVERASPLVPLLRLTESLPDAPPRQFFRAVARLMAETFASETAVAAARFLLGEGAREPWVRQVWRRRVMEPALEAVARYVERRVRRGELRPVDPRVGARLFLGMVMSQVLLGRVIGLDEGADLGPLLEEAVDVFLHGLETRDAGGGARGGGPAAAGQGGEA